MEDIRENLGWLIGSVVTALAMIFGWIYQSGVLSTLIGVAIGAGITYYVQTKTQNRAWKREYAVKIAEQVYGSLFKEIKNVLRSLEEKYYIYWINFGAWKEFQQDHRYFMVDANFRARLDNFAERLEKYSQAAIKLGSEVRKIVFEETERFFGVKTSQVPAIQASYMKGYSPSSTMLDLVQCVVSESHPLESIRREPDASKLDFVMIVTSIENKTTHIPHSSDFDEFWQICLKRMKENDTYKFVTEENGKIIEHAQKLKAEIVERIEKPWKI